MAPAKRRFVVDDQGEKAAVIFDIAEYKRLLEEEAIRAYDAAQATGDEVIPFEQAVEEIENSPCAQNHPSGEYLPE